MTPPLQPIDYAMVTVKLDQPQLPPAQALGEIKKALGLKSPAIDESYGAIPMGKDDQYVVMIEAKLAQGMKDANHPNIVGVFSNPRMEPFTPPAKNKRSPGFGGPCF